MNQPLRDSSNSSLRPRATRSSLTPRPVTSPPRNSGNSPRLAVPSGPGDGPLQRRLKATLLAAVAAGSAFGVVKVSELLETSRHLPLRTVSVVTLSSVQDQANPLSVLDDTRISEVRAYAELEDGEPWLGISIDDVKTKVERHPFVREARVQRRAPDTIEIAVELRAAAAILRQGERLYLVDIDGEVMKRVRPGDDVDLALISLLGPDSGAVPAADEQNAAGADEATRLRGLGEALAIVEACDRHGFATRLSEVVAVPGAGFEVVFDDGARARLGENDIDNKLLRLLSAERRLKEKGRSFSFMWLDDAQRPERVAVRLRPVTETTPVGG